MYNDTISDFLTRIRNAGLAGKEQIAVRSSKTVLALIEILKTAGFIASVASFAKETAETADPRQQVLPRESAHPPTVTVTLSADSPLTHIKRLSRPGVRYYVGYADIPRPRGGTGLVIISTPKGMLTGLQARKQKVGGELICEVW